jgi:DNA-binding MarR family transcriptional regulator
MPAPLQQNELPPEDLAFYGLFWAGNTLTVRVEQHLKRAHDLPVSWFEVLLWLYHQDSSVSVSDLGARTMLSRSQVSRVLDALRERDLIVRIPSRTDARSVGVKLTAEGRVLFEQADATRRACLAEVFTDRLDDDDMAALIGIWRKLRDDPQPLTT